MKDNLLIGMKKFLETRLVPGKPVLVGYSGGPDSKALLYLLHGCRKFFLLDIHLAHVDHGWRAESGGEAEQIRVEANQLGLSLYAQVLNPKDFTQGNLEEQGREHRLRFFSELYTQLNCQALFLGHQADDQAELILKRVFEGASLFNLKGLRTVSTLLGMQVFRPLLHVPKKELLQWLAQKNLTYFEDPTNISPEFLRGRMRQDMLPLLSTHFGKEVSSNLCRLSDEAGELNAYFSEINKPVLACIRENVLDLGPFLPLPPLQLRYLMIEWLKREQVTFSRQMLGDAVKALMERSAQKKFLCGAGMLQIDNGIVRFLK